MSSASAAIHLRMSAGVFAFSIRALMPSRRLPCLALNDEWQARRESNPQPAVLETAALPIELLALRPALVWCPQLESNQ